EQGLLALRKQPYPRPADLVGLADTLDLVADEGREAKGDERPPGPANGLEDGLRAFRAELERGTGGGLLDWDDKLVRLATRAAALASGPGKGKRWAGRLAAQVDGYRDALHD